MNKKRAIGYSGILAVLLAAFLLIGSSCSLAAPGIQNAVVATSIDPDGKPADSVTELTANTPVYASVELHNALEDTKVTFKWYSGDAKLGEVTLASTMGDQYMDSRMEGLTNAGGYKVEVYVDERETPDATLEFTVKKE